MFNQEAALQERVRQFENEMKVKRETVGTKFGAYYWLASQGAWTAAAWATFSSSLNALNSLNSVNARGADDEARADESADARARAQRVCIAYLDALPAGCVGELHVAGYDASGDLVIDDHGSRVRDEVWALHAHALRRFGAPPTLVEWDTALPALDVLLDEAARAERAAQAHAALNAGER